MAAPDLRSLYELYEQLYGGRIRPPQSLQPNPGAQNYDAGDLAGNHMPTGGVLGYLPAPPAAAPVWMRSAMPAKVGFPSPRPSTRFDFGRRFPIPDGSSSVQDMPDPHLERLMPDWMRNLWSAGSLLPRIMASELRHGSADEGAQGSDSWPSSQPQPVRREDRSGGLGWYVGPPDPNKRVLERVDDEAAGEREVESPPLAPDAVDEEACAEEWANARRDCEAGFRGPRGQGPHSIPKGRRGRNYTVDDCARGIVSEICGGNALKKGLSGEQAAKRNNRGIQQKRENRGQP